MLVLRKICTRLSRYEAVTRLIFPALIKKFEQTDFTTDKATQRCRLPTQSNTNNIAAPKENTETSKQIKSTLFATKQFQERLEFASGRIHNSINSPIKKGGYNFCNKLFLNDVEHFYFDIKSRSQVVEVELRKIPTLILNMNCLVRIFCWCVLQFSCFFEHETDKGITRNKKCLVIY